MPMAGAMGAALHRADCLIKPPPAAAGRPRPLVAALWAWKILAVHEIDAEAWLAIRCGHVRTADMRHPRFGVPDGGAVVLSYTLFPYRVLAFFRKACCRNTL
jgi:hypothetical protein